MSHVVNSRILVLAVAALLCLSQLSGCRGWRPDEDGSAGSRSYRQTPDGYYRVRNGDSLHAIAFKYGLDWRDIAAWNGIRSPYTIYPDQELRLSEPATRSVSTGSGTVTTAPGRKQPTAKTVSVPPPATSPAQTSPVKTTRSEAPPPAPAGEPGKWLWPAEGRIISNFKPNDPARKGIDIGGKEGQVVIASAGGQVVYSGSGLIGYGELIIIKHSERLLSAYAHNRKRLVGEGQQVKGGDKIAEMGTNDRNQAMLHFEIRLNGNPQDPLKYLPGR